MRKRAFIPEALGPLDGRALPSGPNGPAHLSAAAYGLDLLQIQGDFQQFTISGNLNLLRTQLAIRARPIPFKQVDGLGPRINAILDRMQADLAAKVPGAVNTAYHQVVATIHDDVQARIDNGTIVVVP